MDFAGKVVLVTGAASGIGRRIAECFAEQKAQVVAADINLEGVREAAGKWLDRGLAVVPLKIDISAQAEVEQAIAQIIAQFGRIDVLVNDAALDQQVMPLAEMDVAMWDRIMSVNVRGTFLVSRFVLPHMIKASHGAVVNVASDLGYIVAPGLGAYCTSKGAVLQLTRVLAAENGPYGIRVNALCPTMVDTPMARRTIDSHPTPEAWVEEIKQGTPLRRLGTVDDVANAALFLASEDAAYINGVCLPVDGGRTIL
jgi:NAD(P)-dependent dehydrogenase (short-subunit alcohol dehydrogenase family)